jgi:putative addiction module component (TIGR02574 family)
MSDTLARILLEVEQLSAPEREELADRLAEDLFRVPPAFQASQLAEVRRRILQIENDEVSPVPGEEAMRRVRGLVEAARARGR